MKQGNFVARICNFKQRGQDGFLEEFQEVSVAKAEQETVGEEAVGCEVREGPGHGDFKPLN